MKLTVNLSKPYDVWVEKGIGKKAGRYLQQVCPKKWAVIMDEQVYDLYGKELKSEWVEQGLRCHFFTFPHGETHKTIQTYEFLCHALLQQGFTRDDGVLAFGGGVTIDLAGFVAATLFRGMHFVTMPTTLLSQVDGCIGGKVGIDTQEGKNLIGAFYQPELVLVDPDYLMTLPKNQVSSGMAEVIKYGFIADTTILDRLEGDVEDMEQLIADCLQIKAKVVEKDELDGDYRHILNFGHTYGHAYEKEYRYQKISHGEAVAAGMAEMLRWQVQNGMPVEKELQRLNALLEKYELPTKLNLISKNDLMNDKKREGDTITIAILQEEGKAVTKTVSVSEL